MTAAGGVAGEALRLLDGLLSPAGRALLDEVMAAPVEPAAELAVGERLRARWPADLVAAAFAQRELRLAARAKFRLAERMLFTRAGLEQASAEAVARHRARRYQGVAAVADVCCGIGGDLVALARGRTVLAVDLDPVHLRMAAENAAVHGVGGGVGTLLADARAAPLDRVEAVFVDPARREGGRRFGPGASEPPLAWCLGLAERVPAVGVKAAPGLPLDLVPAGWEVELIADARHRVAPGDRAARGLDLDARAGPAGGLRPSRGLPARPEPGRDPRRRGGDPGPHARGVEAGRADRLPVRRRAAAHPVRPRPPGGGVHAVRAEAAARPPPRPGRRRGRHPPPRPRRRRRRAAPPPAPGRRPPRHRGPHPRARPPLDAGLHRPRVPASPLIKGQALAGTALLAVGARD